MIGFACGGGCDVPLRIMFDEYASLLEIISEEYMSALNNLIAPFESLVDAMNDLCAFDNILILPAKKKFLHKYLPYQINYIQPQIKLSKNLPYQRRVY